MGTTPHMPAGRETPHKSHKKEYFIIFGTLAVLTVLELLVPHFIKHHTLKISALTFLAFGKAFLVAYFFMHLKEETSWVKIVAAVPLIAILFTVVLILESLAR